METNLQNLRRSLRSRNVSRLLAKRAWLSPDVEAFVDVSSNKRVTYQELNHRTNQLANTLTDLKVGHGDRMAVLMKNSIEYIESFLAASKIGAAAVTLNWRLTAYELEYQLVDSNSSVIIFDEAFSNIIHELFAMPSVQEKVKLWIFNGDINNKPDFALSYHELTQKAVSDEPKMITSPDDILLIMYTSGTTGLPKGVVHSHETTLWGALTICFSTDFRLGDRHLNPMPLFHVAGLGGVIFSILEGITMVLMRDFNPDHLLKTIDKEKITSAFLVPTMLNMCLEREKLWQEINTEQLRWILSGGAPVPVTTIEAYIEKNINILQVYGQTECWGPACILYTEDALQHIGSTGKEFFFTDIKIIRPDGTLVDIDEPGEICIRSPHVMLGYLNQTEQTAETIKDGWLHTGDIATMDSEGYVYIRDRIKDMLISGGENVYPAEIENVLLSFEKIKDCTVIGIPSEKWGESACAIVVKNDEQLTEQDVIVYCQGKLARFKQPTTVYFIDEIPRNPSGKALKHLLRDQFPGSKAA